VRNPRNLIADRGTPSPHFGCKILKINDLFCDYLLDLLVYRGYGQNLENMGVTRVPDGLAFRFGTAMGPGPVEESRDRMGQIVKDRLLSCG
jgi:hypothetical protein